MVSNTNEPRGRVLVKQADNRPIGNMALPTRKLINFAIKLLVIITFGFIARAAWNVYLSLLPIKDESYTMVHHYTKQPGKVHEENTTMDVCRIFPNCFPDNSFKTADSCHRSINMVLQYYDSSAMVSSKGEVVGFISFFKETDPIDPRRIAVHIYNVCVSPQHRNRGISKRMIDEGTKAFMGHYNLGSSPVLLGLDVDLTTPLAAAALSAYAKQGFLRGWQPCASIGDLDWRPLYINPSSETSSSHLAHLLEDFDNYAADVLSGKMRPQNSLPSRRNRKNDPDKPFTHFCMFRWYGDTQDGFYALGQKMATIFQGARRSDSEESS